MCRDIRLILRLVLAMLILLPAWTVAGAHPADEFCGPGSDLDPELCRALSQLDNGDAPPEASALAEEISVDDLDRSRAGAFFLYVQIGFGHILPGGADHILFVLAIYLSTTRLRPLVWQVTAFTLAHTATLALAAAGAISPPPDIVEPLIAATIAFVALENMILPEMARWRPGVVFGFGLIHGMGFAGAFGELGLPPGLFWTSLTGFNVGVELGQLTVLGLAIAAGLALRALLAPALDPEGLYRKRVTWPLSALIGAVGTWWLISRLMEAAA